MLHQYDSRDPSGTLTEQLNQAFALDDRQSGLLYQRRREIFSSYIAFLTAQEMQQGKGA